MSVEIYTGNYMGGMPTFDYSMDINGIRISLMHDDFKELLDKLNKKISEDYQKAVEVSEKYFDNAKKMQLLKKELIGIFWDGDQDDDDTLFFRKEVKDIDREKLFATLDKYNRFLGFE